MELQPVRFSTLKLMAKSPAHYRGEVIKKSRCMEVGSAADALILGTQKVCVYPGKVRNGKEWEAFKAAHTEEMIVTAKEMFAAESMRDAVAADPVASKILTGEHQKEIFWKFLGRDCVSHLDNLGMDGPDSWFVADLKVTQSSSPERFKWHALKMGYHAQLAFYMRAVECLTGKRPSGAFIVAVEPTAPFVVTTLRLTDKALELGDRMVRLWFERLLACESAGSWPGYAQGIVDLDAPEDVALEFDDGPTESPAVPF